MTGQPLANLNGAYGFESFDGGVQVVTGHFSRQIAEANLTLTLMKPVENAFFQRVAKGKCSGFSDNRSLDLASQARRQNRAKYFSQGGEIVVRDPLPELEKCGIKNRSRVQ